ncbi:hypothetical protein LPJ77_000506 [Coemansia sp. RSA 2523]|nr:hypothetical protein LPJ54_000261 [Coemansia sp. RSA 1824]KAJ1810966.1 hypothetical protein LPJ77_000506 [Coemansia sp. RSA 2523]KAJ2148619.1 hypothetical protein IW142_000783 [Coemansia sp. RSA 564]KAJ2154902.1 hypothetical protein J3F82_000815 [Coemansia sp. RSA 637]KAJ2168653.1 hypothetical protein GGH15_001179 [Coemansia sp. RSA 562]KAJ2183042.1 hypothetical protein GGF45_000293 [Coemansia sp. RSA 551]KAJ2250586.1 hypothetical protein GGH97_000568 [Coemansia sp. RSA 475]KAJ2293833.1 h
MASMTQTVPDSTTEHIRTPLAVIHKLFSMHTVETEYVATDFGKLAQSHFQAVFADRQALQQVPVYDQGRKITPGTLVRFRCMVQDPAYGEELHLAVARMTNTATGEERCAFSQYTDAEHGLGADWEVDYGAAANVFTEKEVAYCVSVPGQSAWARGVDDVSETALDSALESLSLSGDGNTRAGADKYPIPGEQHSAALVKFYAPSTAPRVSSVIDVVGVYELGANTRAQEAGDETAWPCIHAIYHSEVHVDDVASALPALQPEDFAARRAMCVEYVTSVLGGDDLAAQYVLLHLLSRTVRVQDAKVGKLSLNLVNVPASALPNTTFAFSNPASRWIGDSVSQLVPYSVRVPFDLKLLNKSSFVPNAEQGDLRAGVLQLAAGTALVCDETCLNEGTLDERGVRNLHAVQTAILSQSVTYQFPFQPVEMPTSLRILVLSAGKSILHSDCVVHISDAARRFLADVPASAADVRPLDPMHMEQLRQYIECARHLEFGIPQAVSDVISTEYAELRRVAHERGEPMMSQEELALTVTVARLISLGKGQAELSIESWNEAVALELRRKCRNPPASKKQSAE